MTKTLPDNALFMQGMGYMAAGRLASAAQIFRSLIKSSPASGKGYAGLGEVMLRQTRLSVALALFETAVQKEPREALFWQMLALCQGMMNRLQDALASYGRALKIQPDLTSAIEGILNITDFLVTHEVRKGNWSTAWAVQLEHDAILHARFGPSYPGAFPKSPCWDASYLAGKTVLLQDEQGYGDSFLMIRFAGILEERGARVIVECRPEMAAVLSRAPGVVKVHTINDAPKNDLRCPLGWRLPALLDITEDHLRRLPYLFADSSLEEHWRGLMSLDPSAVNVGLVWRCSNQFPDAKERSAPLKTFAPLAAIGGVKWYSLQIPRGDEPAPGLELIDLTDRIGSFADTAAMISNLDLVITVDTAVANLAGAMGKKTWTMLPCAGEGRWVDRSFFGDLCGTFHPGCQSELSWYQYTGVDGRWMNHPDRTPWYPSIRLFRQSVNGDWMPVIERVRDELSILAASPGCRFRARKGIVEAF